MNNELYHHGIMGMKWGHRRWQNEDGSYKPGGEEHYYTPVSKKQQKKNAKNFSKALKSKDLYYVDNKFSREVEKSFNDLITEEEVNNIRKLWKETYHSKKYKYYKDPNYADPQLDEKSTDLFYDNLEKYNQACKDVTNKLLGKYGNTKVKVYQNKNKQWLSDKVNFEIARGNVSRNFMTN